MEIFLVRHGQTIENAKKIYMGQRPGKLSSLGRQQARFLAKELKNNQFDIIYSSDLRRCKQTVAEIIKYHKKTPVIYAKELRETNFGQFQGKKWDKISLNDLPGTFMTRKAEGGESLVDVKKRVAKFITYLKKNHSDDTVLLVTHSGVIKTLLALWQKIPMRKVFETVELENTSICEIDILPDKPVKIHCLNKINHL